MQRHVFKFVSTSAQKYSELQIFTMFYNELIAIGFTCDTTIDDQCIEGNVPTFTFTWKNGKSFKIYRTATYETATLGTWYLEIDGHRSEQSTRFSRYSSAMEIASSDITIAVNLMEDDNNFIIEFGGQYGTFATSFSDQFCGWLYDGTNYMPFLSSGGTYNESDSRSLYNRALFYIDGIANIKRLRLPVYTNSMAVVSDLYLVGPSSDFASPLSGSISGYAPNLVACSYVNKWSKISFENKTYFALDCNTLVEIDN